jgi:hypothetical protein
MRRVLKHACLDDSKTLGYVVGNLIASQGFIQRRGLCLLCFVPAIHSVCSNAVCRLGPQLMALDRQNLTGCYALNLSWSVHRAVAQRLQAAALQDIATSECKCVMSYLSPQARVTGLS